MARKASQQTHRLLSAANSVNATLISDRTCEVFGINGFNAGTVSYLKIYDKATAPDENDTPRRTEYLPANARFQIDIPNGMVMSRGLGLRLTTAAADNSTAAVASGAVLALNIDFA